MSSRDRLSAIVLTVAISLPLVGCWEKSPESRIETAKQALHQADYKTAIVELKSALQRTPENAEARLLLAQAFLSSSQWANSETELRKAMDQGIPAERALPLLGKALLKLGSYQKVLDLKIPESGLTSQALASIQAEKANAYLDMNQPTEAAAMIKEGETALAAVGGNAFSNDLQLAKARLAFVSKQPAQSMALLDTVLQRDAQNTDALYMKALLLVKDGKAAEALNVYRQIVAAKPDEILAHLAIADIGIRENDVATAENALKAAEKIDSKMLLVNYTRAKLSLLKGDFKHANEALQQILSVVPDHLPSLILYAQVSYALGNYEQSMKTANTVLVQAPGDYIAMKLVAANDLRRGNNQAVLNSLQPLLPAHQDDIELLAMLGEANLQAKQYDKAMAYFDRAAAQQPKSPVIKQGQARTHLALGQYGQGIIELEEAANLSAKPDKADLQLIALHMARKEFDPALHAIAALEKKSPNNPVTSNLRGMALLGKNDRVGARKSFEQALAIRPDFYSAAANLARLDVEEKKPEVARQRFEAVLKADPQNTQAMLALAELAVKNMNPKEAQDWLEKAAKADPKAIQPRTALVRAYLATKNPQRALAVAREAVDANPKSPEAFILLGSAQMATGDKPGALVTFTKATIEAPYSAEAFYRLGTVQVASQQVSEGRASFEKALALQPGHVAALDGLLLLDMKDNKVAQALQRTRAFQASNPTSPTGFVREGDILYALKQYSQAAKAYEQGLNLGNDLMLFAKLQSVLILSGNLKLADQKLAELLSRFPKDIHVQSLAADYYLTTGRNAESLKIYEGLRQAQPNNAAYLNNMALLYQRMKDRRALPMAEQAVKLAPDNPSFMDTLGWILVDQGQTARAVDLLTQASAKAAGASSIRYHLAVALAKSGKKAEAKRELETLRRAGNTFPEAELARQLAASL